MYANLLVVTIGHQPSVCTDDLTDLGAVLGQIVAILNNFFIVCNKLFKIFFKFNQQFNFV